MREWGAFYKLQTLAYDPGIVARTLRLLAKYQAQKADEWRDAQPGEIMHELRDGELAHIVASNNGSAPRTPILPTAWSCVCPRL